MMTECQERINSHQSQHPDQKIFMLSFIEIDQNQVQFDCELNH